MPQSIAERIGELAVVECKARIIVLDISEVTAIEGGDLGMFFVSRTMGFGSHNTIQAVQSNEVRFQEIGTRGAIRPFNIASLQEMITLFGNANSRFALAA